MKNIALVALENLYKIMVVLLLTGILIMQVLTYLRMPPTMGEYRAVKDAQQRQALYDKMPVVKVNDPVNIEGEVRIDDSFPVQVKIER